jgi:hypothetical protein
MPCEIQSQGLSASPTTNHPTFFTVSHSQRERERYTQSVFLVAVVELFLGSIVLVMEDGEWVLVRPPAEKELWSPSLEDAESSKPLKVTFSGPAKHWTDALPIGNGRLGAMVWGGVATETLQLNGKKQCHIPFCIEELLIWILIVKLL